MVKVRDYVVDHSTTLILAAYVGLFFFGWLIR